ncbi:hypothetical protein BDV30DRAFT_88351 [Aspergillus minisclerotigenes]|uniref:Uncharacterized protein n=1 Tax=Aspergillus minisclerotigenes TaxID=656917 RepID=A0A5N6J8U2_9EURO|nr:hypothetical protein BDV30DRAFT_88351 [Aspergillus minisclerotigenes]
MATACHVDIESFCFARVLCPAPCLSWQVTPHCQSSTYGASMVAQHIVKRQRFLPTCPDRGLSSSRWPLISIRCVVPGSQSSRDYVAPAIFVQWRRRIYRCKIVVWLISSLSLAYTSQRYIGSFRYL